MMKNNISCDTSVLVNFLKVDLVKHFRRLPFRFFIADHVQDEITEFYSDQKVRLQDALDQNCLEKIEVSSLEELEIFGVMVESGQLGAGECAAIAVAAHRGFFLAIDDAQAIKKSSSLLLANRIFRTQDIVLFMIEEKILDIAKADALISVWANEHRFKLKINSFQELMEPAKSG